MVKLVVSTNDDKEQKEYSVDSSVWSELLLHYINLSQTDPDLGECFRLINQNIHDRNEDLNQTGEIIDRLTEINKIYSYLRDICKDNTLNVLKDITSNSISRQFVNFLQQNQLIRTSIIDFLNEYYNTDFKNSDLTAEIWTKMRPISDEGKARGYSGPSELPLVLFAGGIKAKRGDIIVCNQKIEIKGEGGRVGDRNLWKITKNNIESFANQYNAHLININPFQTEFLFDEITTQFANKFDYSMLPYALACIVRKFNLRQAIKTQDDAVFLYGTMQLAYYLANSDDDWFILFKHPGKDTAPFGSSFIIKAKDAKFNFRSVYKLYNALKEHKIGFSPCYDGGGYKIKFLK